MSELRKEWQDEVDRCIDSLPVSMLSIGRDKYRELARRLQELADKEANEKAGAAFDAARVKGGWNEDYNLLYEDYTDYLKSKEGK